MNKIGVNIDLSVFFEDERKMVLVLVDPKWESVECLQKRVCFLFDVDSVRFLNSDGLFLPPQEPIEIIKFCKGLKAFVPNSSLEKRKKKKSKKTVKEDDYESEEINDASEKKRKYHSLESGFLASSNQQSAKRLKNSVAININKEKQNNKSSEISSTSEQMPPPSLVNCKKSDVQSSSVILDKEELGRKNNVKSHELSSRKIFKEKSAEKSGANEGNDDSKRRRSSTPKQKEITEIVHNVKKAFDEEMKARPSGIHSSTLLNESEVLNTSRNKNPFKGKPLSKNKGHIYFNEVGDPLSKSTSITKNESKKSQTITVFRCSLNDINKSSQKPRIFQINSLLKDPKKQLLEIQEEIIIPPKTTDVPLERTDSQEANYSKMEIIDTLQSNTKDSSTDNTTESTIVINSEQISMESTDTTNRTTIAVVKDQTATQNLETIKTESKPDDGVNNQLNDSSVLSIDSGDLSIVIDDEEDDESKNKKEDDESKNNSTKEQSHDLTEDDGHDDSSDVQEISDIIDLNETDDNCDSTVNEHNSGFPNSDIRIHKVLPLCKDMLNLPNVGDIIVFKVPYVDQKRCKLVETNFIAGSAEYINKRTNTIKLAIKDGLSELLYVPTKFVCKESQDTVKHLQLKISDMVKPKFCSRV